MIVGESPGSKVAKAQKAGVPVLAEADAEGAARYPPVVTSTPGAEARVVTKRSCAALAAQDETGLPFSSTANATVLPSRPDSEQAMFVVPVLPFNRPRSGGSRLRSVPFLPATASESTNDRADGGVGDGCADHPDERLRREPVEARQARAVDDANPCDWDPRLPHRRDDDPASPGRRADLPAAAASCLSSISA